VNNFKTIFETHLNSRTNAETLVQLMEQLLYRNPGYCTEMRSYLGTLQQANLLSLDIYATLIAEIEQFEEKHLSITFEHWRTHPAENMVFHKHPLPPSEPPALPRKKGYLIVGSVFVVLMSGMVLWYWALSPDVSSDIQAVVTNPSQSNPPAPNPVTEPTPPVTPVVTPVSDSPSPLRAQSIPAAPPPVSTGDVEPPLPNVSASQTQAIDKLLNTCQAHLEARRLIKGKEGNAVACYRQVLTMDANNVAAQEGLVTIEKLYGEWAEAMLKKKQVQKARVYAQILTTLNPDSPTLHELQQKLATLK
jgi:hypothetical protein